MQPNHHFNSPYDGESVNQRGEIIDYVYLSARPDEIYQFYKLKEGSKIIVKYQQEDLFLISYEIGNNNDPIVGWTDRNHILLDIDAKTETK